MALEPVDLNAGVAAAQAQKGQLDTLFKGQQADTNAFSGSLNNFVNSQPTQEALAARIGGELNLPTLRQNANTLNTEFANLPFTYRDATRGYDVNNNQLSRLIGQKSTDMAPAMTTANNALGVAETQLGTRMGYAQQDFSNRLIPYQSQQQLLTDRLARETTGYTHQMDNDLTALIDKIKNGVALTIDEQDNANKLATAEKQFQGMIQSATIANNKPFALANGSGVYTPGATGSAQYQRFGYG